MGSIRKASNLFILTLAKRQSCLMNVSWSVTANIRAKLHSISVGMWPLNVKCQNSSCQNVPKLKTAALSLRELHTIHLGVNNNIFQSSLQPQSPFIRSNGAFLNHPNGGVANKIFDRLFSTTNCHLSNEPASDKKQPVQPSEEAEKTGTNLKELKENVMTVPNLLTVSRMALSPAIGYLVLMESYALACGIFVFVGITDILDGWIARTYPSQASAAGSFLDPLADKFLVTILFISLTMVDLIPLPLTGLILSRDFLLIAAAFYIRYITLPPPRTISKYFSVTTVSAQLKPMFISKANTAIQLSLVALSLAAPVFGFVDHIALQCLWYLTAGTTFASGLSYVFAKNTFEALRKSKEKL